MTTGRQPRTPPSPQPLPQLWGRGREWGLPLLLLAFAVLYFLTLDNGLRPGELAGGDLITHQYAQVQGRPSNAPGYPLYTMGGAAWYRLGRLLLGPHANPIPILSSYSTLWALLALWLLYRLIMEVTSVRTLARSHSGNWPIALLVTAFYGVTYFFWYYAVTTEQYTSAVAWTLAVVLLAFRWERNGRESSLLAIATLCGVALAHMVTILFVIPPLLWLVLATRPELFRRRGLVAASLGLAALPLLSYAYVYLGGALHPEWRGGGEWASTWQWFWSFLSTRQGRSELTWSLTPFLTREFPSLIWGELTVPGLLAGVVGLAALGRRRGLALYATLAIYLSFCWIDRQGNWYQVIMPAYALLAVGIAAGADWVWRGRGAGIEPLGGLMREREQPAKASNPVASGIEPLGGLMREREQGLLPSPKIGGGAGVRAALVLALLALILYRGLLSFPRANSHNRAEDTGLAPGWLILADDPPSGTSVLGMVDEVLALNYLTEIWGERPDVHSVTSEQAQAAVASQQSAAEQQPVAVTVTALPLVGTEVSPNAHYSAIGRTLVAIRPTPSSELPAWAAKSGGWGYEFETELRLAGGRLTRNRATEELVVLLAWQAISAPSRDWSISVRLTQGGREIGQVDHNHPVAGAYPTSRWAAGEVVEDAYAFALQPGAEPDGLTVIVYRRAADGSFVNLDAARLPLP